MKHTAIFAISLIFFIGSAVSQVPQGFNYQAVARNDAGNPIAAATLTAEISILSDTVLNNYVWQETHTVNTNSYGLFNVVVGRGNREGGSYETFESIDWSAAPLYIRSRIYYQSSWHVMSAAELWSVPYAMVSETAISVLGDPMMINGGAVYIMNNVGIGTDSPGTTKLAVVGDDAQSDDALFEVKRQDGEVIFAVYNHGVRINMPVDTLTKGRRGGFAIGGFDKSKGTFDDYFMVGPDSIRAYVDNSSEKGPRGGFAIGGFDKSKGVTNDLLMVSSDSVRVYINDKPQLKGPRGGFAIGGFDNSKGYTDQFLSVNGSSTRIQVKDTIEGFSVANIFTGEAADFMKVNKVNYFIGHESGIKNSTGVYNSFLGYESGRNNFSGSSNAFFGYQSGYNNISGNGNLFLGYQSGFTNKEGMNNTFLGYRSGFSNTSGDKNTFMGSFAGELNSTGGANMFAGIYSGRSNTVGGENVFLGPSTGESNVDGNKNVFIGTESGKGNITGDQNVFIGASAGLKNNGDDNIFIGTHAGLNNDSGTKNVFIGFEAGFSGTDAYSNVCIGHLSGYKLTEAFQNVFVGESAGKNTTYGESNVFIGNAAGMANSTGGTNVLVGTAAGQKANSNNNTFLGFGAGYEITNGYNNVYVGSQAGFNASTGDNNVAIGNGAGYGNIGGNGNIFIGNYAGFSETSSNRLYIDNSSTGSPLIWGDFSLNKVNINGSLGVGVVPSVYKLDVAGNVNINRGATGVALRVDGDEAIWYDGTYFSFGYGGVYNFFGDKVTIGNSANPGYMLYVQGTAYTTGIWATSDIQFKKELREIDNPLDKVLSMHGVTYRWKGDEYSDRGFPDGRHLGVIAQEIEKVVPDVVMTNSNGEKSVAYNELIPVLIEAIKEQQSIIDDLKERLGRLEAQQAVK